MVDEGYRDGAGVRRRFRIPLGARSPIVTWAILCVNTTVWLAATHAGGTEDPEVLVDFGAMFGPLIANGEYWRLFTAMFLHSGIAHLAFNGFGLFIFGQLVEKSYGHVWFLTIYVLAGLAGSVASYLLNSVAIGAGASGAIFGVMGALAAFFVAQRDTFGGLARRNLTGILVLAGINLAYGLSTPGIDNWAHMGGFAAGFLLGLALAPRYRKAYSPFGALVGVQKVNSHAVERWWVVPATVALLAVGTWLATVTMPDNAFSHIYLAERYYQRQDYDAALEEIDKAVRLDLSIGDAYLLRGRVFAEMGDLRRAEDELARAIQSGDRNTRSEAIALLLALRAQR